MGTPSSAALVTANPPGGGVTTTFTQTGLGVGPGPFVLDGITMTSDPGVVYGNLQYGWGGPGSNGFWSPESARYSLVGTNVADGWAMFGLGGCMD